MDDLNRYYQLLAARDENDLSESGAEALARLEGRYEECSMDDDCPCCTGEWCNVHSPMREQCHCDVMERHRLFT